MKRFSEFHEAVSVQCHADLNQTLWDGDRLRPEVRKALILFGETWRNFANIPEDAVTDILMVGGNASFCYNDNSDIDVHLLVERSRLGLGPHVDDYLADKKTLWSMKHPSVRVKGYTLEPYAQDISEKAPAGQGVFSLKNNHWVQRPVKSLYDPEADPNLDGKIQHWTNVINRSLETASHPDQLHSLKSRISEMRKTGLAAGGEFSPENLIFKSLRNDGHLQKISDKILSMEDQNLSVA